MMPTARSLQVRRNPAAEMVFSPAMQKWRNAPLRFVYLRAPHARRLRRESRRLGWRLAHLVHTRISKIDARSLQRSGGAEAQTADSKVAVIARVFTTLVRNLKAR